MIFRLNKIAECVMVSGNNPIGGIDKAVVIPVTEKLMEQFVASKLFIVLDRSFIQKTLSEKSFSVSDLVANDERLSELGGFLKATYIIVSTVQKIEDQYFISAKMIQVTTGIIIAQASEDKTGTAKVLIDMSKTVGLSLVYAAMGQKGSVDAGKPVPAKIDSSLPSVKTDVSAADMVLVQGGSFQMGSPASEAGRDKDEGPQHTVTLADFYIAKFEITQGEWTAVMGSNPSGFKGNKLPVEQVSWYDAVVYCNRRSIKEGLEPCYVLNGQSDPDKWGAVPDKESAAFDGIGCNFSAKGYRMPTEAEWEYAAKGGFAKGGAAKSETAAGAPYPGGSSPDTVAWYVKNTNDSGTKTAGTKKPNELGIFDMSGNVWEWCWDWYGNYSKTPQTSPEGGDPGDGRVIRGGGWTDKASDIRASVRDSSDPWEIYDDVGFRAVRSR